jgi:hypothetical protein
VDSSGKLEEPDRAVRQVPGRHSRQRADSYVTYIRETDVALDNLAETIDDEDVMTMIQKIMTSYAKACGKESGPISSVVQNAKLPWCYIVKLPNFNYCWRKDGYHSNAQVFYRVNLMSNQVYQSCFSGKCDGKPEGFHEHTEGYFGDLFEMKEFLNLQRVKDIFTELADRFGYRPVADILKELLTLSTQGKQTRMLKLELEKRQFSPGFVGHFMTAIMPYLNCFWGKTTFTPKPVVISPYMHTTLDGQGEFATEAIQPLSDFVQSHTQYQIGKGQDIPKLWLTHEKACKYFTMQFVPRLIGNKPGIYNMFHGFSYPIEVAKLLPFEMSEVQPLLDHVRLIWAKGTSACTTISSTGSRKCTSGLVSRQRSPC